MSIPGRERLILPLDVPSLAEARSWVSRLAGHVGLFKVGLELYSAQGPEAVRAAAADSGTPVFLDLKLHDIPATVAGAVRAVRALGGVRFLTVHVAGGLEMLRAAVQAAGDELGILGVTRLTSLAADTSDVVELARVAREAGCAGVVCSGHEAEAVRATVGKRLEIVCPGVRPRGVSADDQARVMTPSEAIRAGADYLVIGRAIRDAADPVAAADAIAREVGSLL